MSQTAPLALIVLNFIQVVELKTFSTTPIGALPGRSTFVFFCDDFPFTLVPLVEIPLPSFLKRKSHTSSEINTRV
jgi:hypothetical protein